LRTAVAGLACSPAAASKDAEIGAVASAEVVGWRLRQAVPMRRHRVAGRTVQRSAFAGFQFPSGVITVAVRWYLRYSLSYRDVEELLAERGIDVDHVTVFRWVQRFTPLFAEAARPCRHASCSTPLPMSA
jgi:hypothetical protein